MNERPTEFLDEIMAAEPGEGRADDVEILELARSRWRELEQQPDAWIGHEELVKSLRS